MDLFQACEREVVGLYAFFEQWNRGDLPEEAISRFADCLAPEFLMIFPSGRTARRDEIIDMVRGNHASRRMLGTDYRIRIEAFEPRWIRGDSALITYEEWQDAGTTHTARLATALLERSDSAPEGVIWVHLHETWQPQ